MTPVALVSERLVAEIRELVDDARRRRMTAARLAALGAVLWAISTQTLANLPGATVVVPLLMAGAAASWLGWMASRHFGTDDRATWVSLVALAAFGGVLVPYAPLALAMVAVAGLGAGIALEGRAAWAVGVVGAVALVVAVGALGPPGPGELVAEGILSAAAGVLVGRSRRQYLRQAAQAEELLAARVRADAERDRAAALAERNRLGREIHDVLAHSLGALSVQLEAADALLDGGGDIDKVRALVHEARSSAVSGLEETRQAVHALRDEPIALAEQLDALARREHAALTVTGTPRPLGADAGLALYRAAQEACSNARKHAPGASVSIELAFGTTDTVLVVRNGESAQALPASVLAQTGGGFGLRGMRERVEHLGGEVVAGPAEGGFTVQVALPA